MFRIYSILLFSVIVRRTVVSVNHSLLGTYIAVNSDEFTCVLWLDGEAVDSYSSNGTDSVPHRNWMREGRGRSLWKSVKRLNMEHWNRGRTDILKNYTGLNMSGAAVLQGRFGCEIERNPDSGVRLMRTFAQYGWNGEDFLSFSLSRLQWEASAGSAVPMKRKWNRDQDITMETNNYIEHTCVIHLLDSLSFEAEESQETVSHSLLGTYTAVNSDEFTCVLWLDGEAVDSYSSNGMDSVPRRNWMREGRGRSLWKSVKQRNMEHWNRGRTDILKEYTGLNMSGAAVLQGRFGCEIELNPDSVSRTRTFAQYGWNGEDFLSFNLSRLQWEASAGSAVPMKRKWNRDQDITMETKKYMEDICVIDLLDSLSFEAEESQETAQPTTAVFAKRYWDPEKVILTCLVSGFHCRDMTVEVYRDDDIITEEDGLLSSWIRPNGDGTCQLRKSLDISNSIEASYSCEVQFRSLKQLVKWDGKIWDRAELKQNNETGHYYHQLLWDVLSFVIGFSPVFSHVIHYMTLRHRWHTQRTEDSGCFSHFLACRCNSEGMKPSSVDSSS
ncbi:major histocompatibility complex class I-related gene protein-like [Anguilla anguilla]|uniref:major histocompatibility complex class I-related gene protein-like n=1 Tax=Anguilla anguilla TaxID=7936 RepID=UPI0015AF9DF2|nr:major histocompatibility complex class I-related gene protein-like [Anguilla anguilla]